MPSSALIPFLVGLGSLINSFKQKRALFNPRLLGNPGTLNLEAEPYLNLACVGLCCEVGPDVSG